MDQLEAFKNTPKLVVQFHFQLRFQSGFKIYVVKGVSNGVPWLPASTALDSWPHFVLRLGLLGQLQWGPISLRGLLLACEGQWPGRASHRAKRAISQPESTLSRLERTRFHPERALYRPERPFAELRGPSVSPRGPSVGLKVPSISLRGPSWRPPDRAFFRP